MIENNAIMKALPMVASVLGRKYGVNVEIGGDKAYTDGNTIHLPTLPLESDGILTGLLRGFTDHESAHIRETDFDVLKVENLTELEKNIWNIYEDWRVEHALAKRFPGCRINFDWLIDREFTKPIARNKNTAIEIVNYLLFYVRSWDVKTVEQNKKIIGASLQNAYPNLYAKLNKLLERVKTNCHSSADCMKYAKETVALIKAESIKVKNKPKKEAENVNTKSVKAKNATESTMNSGAAKKLQNLLNACASDLPDNLGERLAQDLESAKPKNQSLGLNVATEAEKQTEELSSDDILTVKRASSALHARLQSLLQTTTLVRRTPGRRGKLDTGKLYKINHSAKIFLRNGERQGISTAVHLLLDVSSSMRNKIKLACLACYSIANSLSKINGISVGVTAFPVGCRMDPRPTVYPLLKHDQNLHRNFSLNPAGSTPMGEALWRVMQQIYALKENRKIILIITDGKPDCVENTDKAIEHGRKMGFEFYGIGINDPNIQHFLPQHSKVITALDELAPSMFKLLERAFVQ